jgi:beta-lactamase class A
MVGGSDALAYSQAGERFTVGSLIHAMITVSDNTASNALISTLGFERINRTAARIGLEQTHLHSRFLDSFAIVHRVRNVTSARDLGTLLYALEHGAREGITTIASPRSCRRMIDILLHQEDREKIARGLPRGVPLANKTGEVSGVRNDVGIIDPFGDVPYVLAILTKDLDNYVDGVNAIIRITRRVNFAMNAGRTAFSHFHQT